MIISTANRRYCFYNALPLKLILQVKLLPIECDRASVNSLPSGNEPFGQFKVARETASELCRTALWEGFGGLSEVAKETEPKFVLQMRQNTDEVSSLTGQ